MDLEQAGRGRAVDGRFGGCEGWVKRKTVDQICPPTPPGVLRTEAGNEWEHLCLGGKFQHIEHPKKDWEAVSLDFEFMI